MTVKLIQVNATAIRNSGIYIESDPKLRCYIIDSVYKGSENTELVELEDLEDSSCIFKDMLGVTMAKKKTPFLDLTVRCSDDSWLDFTNTNTN